MLNAMLGPWPTFSLQFPPPYAPAHAGSFDWHRADVGASSMRYKLFVPSTYDGTPLPLVVMLHGGGQNADDFALGTGMNELAEEVQCLVAYPEQSAGGWNKFWNWFDDAHHQRGQGEPALIAAATRDIMAAYAVDGSRVCVAGLSSGGAMAVILGRTYPDLFTAVGCHSGLAHGCANSQYGAMLAMRDGVDLDALAQTAHAGSVPTIVFHGDADYTVHPKNGDAVVRQAIDAHVAQTGLAHADIASFREIGELGGRGFTRHVHRGDAGQVVAEQWILHGGGHAWSGGNRRGSYTETGGPDASREMLRFFLGQPAPHHADERTALA